jgi:hypothetical protein
MSNALSKSVLVLNKSYLAIKVTDVKTAICILWKNQAKVLNLYLNQVYQWLKLKNK